MVLEAIDYYYIALRWTHVFAGITWIGLLYYFNFVQVPTFKELDGSTKNVLIPRLVKRALAWFRYSALLTVVVGWLYFFSRWADLNIRAGQVLNLATSGWWFYSILAGGLFGTFMLAHARVA